jgi:hypothetical protein
MILALVTNIFSIHNHKSCKFNIAKLSNYQNGEDISFVPKAWALIYGQLKYLGAY